MASMSNQAIAAIVASLRLTSREVDLIKTILAPAAALIGVWLGAGRSAKAEDRRWRRDRRAQAYLDLISVAEDFRYSLSLYDRAQLKEFVSNRESIKAMFTPLLSALSSQHLYGNPRISELANKLLDELGEYSKADPSNRDALSSRVRAAISELTEACRADLGLPRS